MVCYSYYLHTYQSQLVVQDIHFLNETEYRKNQDEFISIHPEILEHYYNIEGNIIHCQTHQTGAGYPSDEEADLSSNSGSTAEVSEEADPSEPSDSDCEEEQGGQIAADIRANIYYKPVKVLRSRSPFTTMAHKRIFFRALTDIHTAGLISNGYKVKPSEQDDRIYPTYEIVSFRCEKELIVDLPVEIQLPHAVAQVQGLVAIQHMIYEWSDKQMDNHGINTSSLFGLFEIPSKPAHRSGPTGTLCKASCSQGGCQGGA